MSPPLDARRNARTTRAARAASAAGPSRSRSAATPRTAASASRSAGVSSASPPSALNSGTRGTLMKIGSIAIALIAEYGDCCPGAISLSGSSCRMRCPAPASHRVTGSMSPMSPMPQLAVDGQENNGMSRPARRRPTAASVMNRPAKRPSKCRSSRETPSENATSDTRRLTIRNDSREKSKKYPGCASTPSSVSRSTTRSSSDSSEGTCSTAYQPPALRSARHDGTAPARATARR